jgi:hypothetical protein
MSVITTTPSFSSIRSAPLDYRIRARQVEAAAGEVAKVVATTAASTNHNEDLAPGVEALTTQVSDFDARWTALLQTLEQSGLPGLVVDPLLEDAREFVESSRWFAALLRQHTDAYTEPLAKVTAILDRIAPQIQALRSATGQTPPGDADRLERGLREMERGEGVDSGKLLQKYQGAGEL